MRIATAIMFAAIPLMPLATCTPSGRIDGTYNATTGEIGGAVGIEFKKPGETVRLVVVEPVRRVERSVCPVQRFVEQPCK